MKRILSVLFLLLAISISSAISPQFWEENTQQNLADGDPQSVSITSDGELLLAPQLKKVYEGSDAIIWKIVRDSKVNLFTATGNDGKVIKIDSTGIPSVFLDTNELGVQALIPDKDGNLFAATSPDGKIYRIKPDGTSSIFFDPADKYIWSLSLDDSGNLYAGTGDQGKIYKIDKDGNGKVLIDTNENNITVLAWDREKKLLAGSDSNGILYSIDSSGKAFVLFDSDLQQITSIFPDPSGEIYFAAIVGIPSAPMLRPSPEPIRTTTTTQTQEPVPTPDEGSDVEVTTSVEVSALPSYTLTPLKTTGASQLYRISPEGYIENIYTLAEDQILDINSYKDEMVLLSTGKKAKLISLDKNRKSTILLKVPEEQITSLFIQQGRIWMATANPGNIYELTEKHAAKGTYYSDIKDTQTTSTWGQISWKANVPQGTTLSLSTRSGNTKTPDETWSGWSNGGNDPLGKRIECPKSRFIQWKADFSTSDPGTTSVLHGVSIAYLQQNLRPEMLSITIHPSGAVYRKAQMFSQDSFAGVSDNVQAEKDQQENPIPTQPGFELSPLGKREYKKGFQTITWTAVDQNQDELRFDIFYKEKGVKDWKQLATALKEKVYAWDTQTLPDGTYLIKIVANDSGSNPKEYVLNNWKESDPFDVDNSAPSIEVLKNSIEKNKRMIEVRAKDQFSPIKEMQYSVTPGEWNIVFPVDSINDSLTETYLLAFEGTETGNLVLKCSDQVNNTSTMRYTIR